MATNKEKPANPFQIDSDSLDSEWLQQAQHSRKAGRREADARHVHAQAKARLEIESAKIKHSIRLHPDKYGLGNKPSVDQVESALMIQPEYQKLVDALNDAKRDLDYATADTVAFVDRRKALENLVELLQLNYFSEQEPRASSSEAREQMQNRTRKKIMGSGLDD